MIVINNEKAIEIAKNKIRVWRESELKKNDLAIQNALVDGSNTTALIERRDYLRDLTNQCNSKTLEQLLSIIKTLGA